MSHKYRTAIGRESQRPANRGLFVRLEPRRRNDRQIISFAARTQGGKQLLRPFVCLQKDVAARYRAKGVLPVIGRHILTNFGRGLAARPESTPLCAGGCSHYLFPA